MSMKCRDSREHTSNVSDQKLCLDMSTRSIIDNNESHKERR